MKIIDDDLSLRAEIFYNDLSANTREKLSNYLDEDHNFNVFPLAVLEIADRSKKAE